MKYDRKKWYLRIIYEKGNVYVASKETVEDIKNYFPNASVKPAKKCKKGYVVQL